MNPDDLWSLIAPAFAQTFAPMTEAEGRQYEAEEMAAGRENKYDERGFLIDG